MLTPVIRSEARSTLGALPVLRNLEWECRFPGLVAGITCAAPAGSNGDGEPQRGGPTDFGLSTGGAGVERRYAELASCLGMDGTAVGYQVHGAVVAILGPSPQPGLRVEAGADGLVSLCRGRLLCATVADCVPVYLAVQRSPAVALLHAGWRGVVAGVLETGLDALCDASGAAPSEVHVHLGPAICGECYEVGADVLEQFGRRGAIRGHLDLRADLAARLHELGITPGNVSTSSWCTRCSSALLHSHRARGPGAGRMAAFLGWSANRGFASDYRGD